jgi:hypothetical protein
MSTTPAHSIKSIIRACIKNPNQWVEVERVPAQNSRRGGLHRRRKMLAEYGLRAEVRSIDDEYVLFAALVPWDAL